MRIGCCHCLEMYQILPLFFWSSAVCSIPKASWWFRGGKHLNVSGADRGTVVYCHGNPESLQIGSKCQIFKQTVLALFRGTRFAPGVDTDLWCEGAGSFRWNVRAIMWKGMQRQSRVPVCSFCRACYCKVSSHKSTLVFFLNPSMSTQIAFQQDTPLNPTSKHP